MTKTPQTSTPQSNVRIEPSRAPQNVPSTFPVNKAYPASDDEFKKAFELLLASRNQKKSAH